jgi:hypothetical protein
MHISKAEDGRCQAGFQRSDQFDPLGPAFVDECWAAAYAAFLNGGRFNPDEIEHIFGVDRSPKEEEDDTSIHPDRPKSFDDDYPLERKRG